MANQYEVNLKVKYFLDIKWNEKKCVILNPDELNPFLRVLEVMKRPCYIDTRYKVTLTGLEPVYWVYPKVYGANRLNPEKVLGIDYVDNKDTLFNYSIYEDKKNI